MHFVFLIWNYDVHIGSIVVFSSCVFKLRHFDIFVDQKAEDEMSDLRNVFIL